MAGMAYWLFGMPVLLCFTLAYVISCISPSVMIPGLISLMDRGYGHEKGLCSALIAAGTFEDIICIFFFSLFKAIAFSAHGLANGSSMSWVIGRVVLENFIGLLVGVIMGFLSSFLNRVPDRSHLLKMWYCIACAVFFIVLGEETELTNMKYIASLTLGYVCSRVWGEDKPKQQLGTFWWLIHPLVFRDSGFSLRGKSPGRFPSGTCLLCHIRCAPCAHCNRYSNDFTPS